MRLSLFVRWHGRLEDLKIGTSHFPSLWSWCYEVWPGGETKVKVRIFVTADPNGVRTEGVPG